jgi:hypothetical protein
LFQLRLHRPGERQNLTSNTDTSSFGLSFLSAAGAATNIEDSAAARWQLSAVSTQLSVQRSASKISRNFFAKCKEVTEEKLSTALIVCCIPLFRLSRLDLLFELFVG